MSTKITLLYIESIASEIHIQCFLFSPLIPAISSLSIFIFYYELACGSLKNSSNRTRIPSPSLYHVCTISLKISVPALRISYGDGEVTELCFYHLQHCHWCWDSEVLTSQGNLFNFFDLHLYYYFFLSHLGNFQNIFTYYRIFYFKEKILLLPHFNNCPPFLCFLAWQKHLVRFIFHKFSHWDSVSTHLQKSFLSKVKCTIKCLI